MTNINLRFETLSIDRYTVTITCARISEIIQEVGEEKLIEQIGKEKFLHYFGIEEKE